MPFRYTDGFLPFAIPKITGAQYMADPTIQGAFPVAVPLGQIATWYWCAKTLHCVQAAAWTYSAPDPLGGTVVVSGSDSFTGDVPGTEVMGLGGFTGPPWSTSDQATRNGTGLAGTCAGAGTYTSTEPSLLDTTPYPSTLQLLLFGYPQGVLANGFYPPLVPVLGGRYPVIQVDDAYYPAIRIVALDQSANPLTSGYYWTSNPPDTLLDPWQAPYMPAPSAQLDGVVVPMQWATNQASDSSLGTPSLDASLIWTFPDYWS